jgi:hypothetical protein
LCCRSVTNSARCNVSTRRAFAKTAWPRSRFVSEWLMNASPVNRLRKALWLVGAFAFCCIAGGWIWWRGSYQEYSDGGFHWETLPLIAGVAFSLSWILDVGIIPSGLIIGSAFPAIILGRIVVDCVQDPTDHNLLPFEVGAAFILGMMMAVPSAALGRLLRRMTHRGQGIRP